LQRFISQDPIGFRARALNLYGYVRNSPTNLRDRSGLQDEPPFDPEDPSDPDNPENPYGNNPALEPESRSSTPIGRRNNPIQIPSPINEPADICGRRYTGHALDKMSSTGIIPSAVDEAISNGSTMPGRDDRTVHIDLNNGVTVVTDPDGTVVTVYPNSR
jgi:hypothetical protein